MGAGVLLAEHRAWWPASCPTEPSKSMLKRMSNMCSNNRGRAKCSEYMRHSHFSDAQTYLSILLSALLGAVPGAVLGNVHGRHSNHKERGRDQEGGCCVSRERQRRRQRLGAVGYWALGMRRASRGVRSANCDLRARPAEKLAPGGAAVKTAVVSVLKCDHVLTPRCA